MFELKRSVAWSFQLVVMAVSSRAQDYLFTAAFLHLLKTQEASRQTEELLAAQQGEVYQGSSL